MTLYYMSLLSERQIRDLTQAESDAPSWVKHTKGGLPASGHWNFIPQKTSVDVEQHHSYLVLARKPKFKKK
jgi:hypothetical protein